MRASILTGLALAAAVTLTACGSGSASRSPVQPARPGQVSSLTVPHSFAPVAASFVSPAWGVVLGGAGCTAGHACRAQLAVTADGGAYWSVMRAPAVWLDSGGTPRPVVSQVVFADRADGWLYGQYFSDHIWVTRNGGASWREITLPANVQAMAVAGNAVYAVAGKAYAVDGSRLYRSPLGRNAWMPVNPWPQSGPMTGSILAVSGDAVWFGGSYLWATANGVRWSRYPLPAEGTYIGIRYTLAGIAAASPSHVAFLYAASIGMYNTGMKVMVSFNGGRSDRQTLKAPPTTGDVAAFAVAPGRFDVISIAVVVPAPHNNIYGSANLGQSWTTSGVPGTAMLNSLEFMSPAVGCVVALNLAYGMPSQLLRTANAGRTWYPVSF